MAKMICGNAHKCHSTGCDGKEPHKRMVKITDCHYCVDTCNYGGYGKKVRPCVSVKSKRGKKVLRKLAQRGD